MKKLITKKLIIAARGKTVYHYWREVKTIDKDNLFYVEELEIHKGIPVVRISYIIYKKKLIEDWGAVIDTIDLLIIERKRDYKIKMILG